MHLMSESDAPKSHTMLLGFQVENVRSFRNRIDFSLEATAMAEPEVVREIPWRIDGRNFMRVLPAAGVFGANASGKSNLLRAMADMRSFVMKSYTTESRHAERPLSQFRRPFRLDAESQQSPSTFEIDVILDGVRHEYGFVVDDECVLHEWARRYPNGKAATIFERAPHYMRTESRSAKSRAMRELLREDALFLSVAEAAEYRELQPLYQWFRYNLKLSDASRRARASVETARLMVDDNRRQQVLELLRLADLGITDARRRERNEREIEMFRTVLGAILTSEQREEVTTELENNSEALAGIELSHRGSHDNVAFDSDEESLGTLVWLALAGPLLEALVDGTVLLVDELEASLHPLLVEQFVLLFQSPIANPNGAQLIFNSHEARLLGNSPGDRLIGRDQAWFTEKLDDGSSRLYSLADLNPRKAEAIAKRYMQGRYGATPIISPGEFTALASMLATSSAGA
jgi:uncharacterized protein